jgi:hypothetical protein
MRSIPLRRNSEQDMMSFIEFLSGSNRADMAGRTTPDPTT